MPTTRFSPRAAAALFALLALFTAAHAQLGPESVLPPSKRFQKRVLTTGLQGPWELAWGPDNMLWVTERTGKRILRVDPKTGAQKVAATIDEVSAPGGQDGLLGLTFHPQLLKGSGNDFVYIAYTYQDRAKGPDPNVRDEASPFRYLYGKVVRFRYDPASQTLTSPTPILTGLPFGDDHNGGRIKFGPNNKLFLTTGDQGHNQFGNFCLPIEAQRLPTAAEIAARDYSAYVGKSLRLNLDGSIPADNPTLNGVRSHVYTYGHRNPQGLDIASNGVIYSSEHGPKTDDEVNILTPGANYGWPHVAGLRDDKAYIYARWGASSTPCAQLTYDDLNIPASVPQAEESAFTKPFANPLATMFTVPTGFNFANPICKGADVICWPTTGVSSVEYYASQGSGIPGWDHVLLVPTLKRGSLYVLPLTPDGKSPAGPFSRYFQSENRFRDSAVSPDRRTIYLATDPGGMAAAADAAMATKMLDPGAIIAFTYTGEGAPEPVTPSPATATISAAPAAPIPGATAPRFTTEQAATGKTAYTASCAVCHGTTLTNGAYGTPLAGQAFQAKWANQTVAALLDRSRKTMPPPAPGSLPAETYANIVAYILEVNGYHPARGTPLTPTTPGLEKMVLK